MSTLQKERLPGEGESNKEETEQALEVNIGSHSVNFDSLVFYTTGRKFFRGNLDTIEFDEVESLPEGVPISPAASEKQARQQFAARVSKRFQNNSDEIPDKIPTKRKLQGNSILDFANAPIDHSKTLLGDRWLSREGGAILVAPSGMGKSSWSVQAAAQWSVGRDAFGITAHGKPLKILIVQAEDDDGDCTEMARVIDHLDFSNHEKNLLAENTRLEHVNDVSGQAFIETLDGFLEQFPADLVIINPLTSYLGGDEKDTGLCNQFFRNWLNPVLEKRQCAALIIHHTPKTNFNSTDNYSVADWQYRGSGVAGITNWARAYITIDPCGDGVFRFIAAKRGQRLDWYGSERYFSHSKEKGVIKWEDSNEQEISGAKASSRGAVQVDLEKVLAIVPAIDPIEKTAVLSKVMRECGIGDNKAKNALSELAAEGKIHHRTIPNPSGKGRSLAGWSKAPEPEVEPEKEPKKNGKKSKKLDGQKNPKKQLDGQSETAHTTSQSSEEK